MHVRSELLHQISYPWLGRGPRPEDLEKGGRENMDFLRKHIISFTLTRSIKEVLHKGHTHNGERS